MKTRILSAVVAAQFFAFAPHVFGEAVTETWVNTTDTATLWEKDANWQSGAAPGITNDAAYDLTVELPAPSVRQVITLPYWNNSETARKPWRLGAITGGTRHELEFRVNLANLLLSVKDTSRFLGTWSIYGKDRSSRCGFRFRLDPGGSTRVAAVHVPGRFQFQVPTGASATLGRPIGDGWIDVNRTENDNADREGTISAADNKGTFEVEDSPGGATHVKVWNGTLRLHGVPDAAPAPAEGAWARFDASAAGSFTTNGVNVAEWRDADGRAIAARATGSASPTLAQEGGRPVVDFGPLAADGTGAQLLLTEERTDIRAAFFVFRDLSNTGSRPRFAGYVGQQTFARPHQPGRLFDPTERAVTLPVRTGDVRIDGQAVRAEEQGDYTRRLHVVSVSLDGTGAVSALGGDGSTFAGGLRLAEVLLYTNALTRAQRRQTAAWMRAKWQDAADAVDWDWGTVEYANGATLDIADGVVTVRELRPAANATSLVKTGAGTLVVERVANGGDSLPVEVKGGSVVFRNQIRSAADPQPAADPDVWFDASDRESLDIVVSNNLEYVRGWSDVRGTNHKGETPSLRPGVLNGQSTAWPVRVEDATSERHMVDTGAYKVKAEWTGWTEESGRTTRLHIYKGNSVAYDNVREGFCVYRKTDARCVAWAANNWAITSTTPHDSHLLDPRYSHAPTVGGDYALNGVGILPWNCAQGVDETFVLHFRLPLKMSINQFSADRDDYDAGGMRLAEVLYYDRPLTDQEARDTEAYLLRKWRKEPHPADAAAESGTISFVDAAPETVVVGYGGEMTLQSLLPGTNATAFVKKGDGDLMVANAIYGGIRDIAVEGGTLTATFVPDPLTNAWMHIDATATGSVEFVEGTNAFTKINDPRGNAFHAAAATTSNAKKPTLQMVDIVGDGRLLPVVDTGDFYHYQHAVWLGTATGGGMTITNNAGWLNWSSTTGLAEFVFVFADSHMNDAYWGVGGETDKIRVPPIISKNQKMNDPPGNDQIAFYRTKKPILDTWATPAVANGVKRADGEPIASSYTPGDDVFHVYTFAPKYKQYHVDACGLWSGASAGGLRLAEVAAFTETNSVARREAIERHLMRKWLGRGDATEWTYRRLVVNAGATLNLTIPDWFAPAVETLGANGTINLSGPGGIHGVQELLLGDAPGEAGTLRVAADVTLAEGAAISCDYAGPSAHDAFSVDGTLTLPATATLTISAADEAVREGFALMEATTLAGATDLSGWTLVGATGRNWRAVPRVKGNRVVVDFIPQGTMFIVR